MGITSGGFQEENLVHCPAEPSSILRGRLGRVGYSGGRGGVIWGCVVYIISWVWGVGCGDVRFT